MEKGLITCLNCRLPLLDRDATSRASAIIVLTLVVSLAFVPIYTAHATAASSSNLEGQYQATLSINYYYIGDLTGYGSFYSTSILTVDSSNVSAVEFSGIYHTYAPSSACSVSCVYCSAYIDYSDVYAFVGLVGGSEAILSGTVLSSTVSGYSGEVASYDSNGNPICVPLTASDVGSPGTSGSGFYVTGTFDPGSVLSFQYPIIGNGGPITLDLTIGAQISSYSSSGEYNGQNVGPGSDLSGPGTLTLPDGSTAELASATSLDWTSVGHYLLDSGSAAFNFLINNFASYITTSDLGCDCVAVAGVRGANFSVSINQSTGNATVTDYDGVVQVADLTSGGSILLYGVQGKISQSITTSGNESISQLQEGVKTAYSIPITCPSSDNVGSIVNGTTYFACATKGTNSQIQFTVPTTLQSFGSVLYTLTTNATGVNATMISPAGFPNETLSSGFDNNLGFSFGYNFTNPSPYSVSININSSSSAVVSFSMDFLTYSPAMMLTPTVVTKAQSYNLSPSNTLNLATFSVNQSSILYGELSFNVTGGESVSITGPNGFDKQANMTELPGQSLASLNMILPTAGNYMVSVTNNNASVVQVASGGLSDLPFPLSLSTSTTTSTTTTTTTSSSSSSTKTTTASSSSSSSSSQTSSSSTSTQASSSSSNNNHGGGGIPEFPFQFAVTLAFTVLIVGSYLVIRRSRFIRLRIH